MGAIKGTVKDEVGAVIPGATIKITKREEQWEFSTISKNDGSYIIRKLPPGLYDIEFILSGFDSSYMRSVNVLSFSSTIADMTLYIAGMHETVTVTTSMANQILETSASTGTVLRGSGILMKVAEETFTPRLRDYFRRRCIGRHR